MYIVLSLIYIFGVIFNKIKNYYSIVIVRVYRFWIIRVAQIMNSYAIQKTRLPLIIRRTLSKNKKKQKTLVINKVYLIVF